MASGIAALWGPAHGGANEAVLKVGRPAASSWLHAWLHTRLCPPPSSLLTATSFLPCLRVQMLEEINSLGGVEAIPTMVARAKDKADPFRLMGFGHRVYKVRGCWGEEYEARCCCASRCCTSRCCTSSPALPSTLLPQPPTFTALPPCCSAPAPGAPDFCVIRATTPAPSCCAR